MKYISWDKETMRQPVSPKDFRTYSLFGLRKSDSFIIFRLQKYKNNNVVCLQIPLFFNVISAKQTVANNDLHFASPIYLFCKV